MLGPLVRNCRRTLLTQLMDRFWRSVSVFYGYVLQLFCLIIYLLFRILLSLLPSITSMFSISFSWLFFFQSYIMHILTSVFLLNTRKCLWKIAGLMEDLLTDAPSIGCVLHLLLCLFLSQHRR